MPTLPKLIFIALILTVLIFYSTNLRGTHLIEAKNLTFSQIKSACHWEKAIYKGIWDTNKFKWVTDKAANQKIHSTT